MKRRTFDLLASIGGLALAVVLLLIGVLFQQNANFAKDNVRSQLEEQKVFFPSADDLTEEEKDLPNVEKYAGEQVDNGAEAKAYSEFIGLHLTEVNDGKTYSETSTESRANPENEELKAAVQTLFRGETLRGLLLTAYAFSTLGEKAQQLAIVTFVGAGVFLLLALLGFWHYRRTPATAEI